MKNTVAVIGLGVVSALGIGIDNFWRNLIAGESGISKIDAFDTSKYSREYAGEIKRFDPDQFMPAKTSRLLGRAAQFAIAATKLALEDACIRTAELKSRKVAVILGTTLPEGNALDHVSRLLVQKEISKLSPRDLLSIFPPSIPMNVSAHLGIESTNFLIPCACAAGNYAIGYGFDLLQSGAVDLAIVGGAEAISRLTFQGFHRLAAMAPEKCAPFDRHRKGMLVGEGAGILILERSATKNSSAYAQILGYGLSCDAHHIAIPKKEGLKKAITKALGNAKITAGDLDYINAHGTGTLANDKTESAVIKELFSARPKKIPVSSIKSMLGHCMGAASSIEAIACCMALKEQLIPPTINFTTADPECDIDCVPNKARRIKLKTVLNNSFAFGGNNCCVVFAN
ncbi:beta-ketoacyl-[acyl-carrier-protein] synthase family protein [Candidatus Omnitrophota bacterium]